MQVKLFLLVIWTADCTLFLLENRLHGCQIFARFGFGSDILYPNQNRISDIRTPLAMCVVCLYFSEDERLLVVDRVDAIAGDDFRAELATNRIRRKSKHVHLHVRS